MNVPPTSTANRFGDIDYLSCALRKRSYGRLSSSGSLVRRTDRSPDDQSRPDEQRNNDGICRTNTHRVRQTTQDQRQEEDRDTGRQRGISAAPNGAISGGADH